MGPGLSPRPSTACFPGCAICLPIASITGPNLREALAKFGDWTIEIVTRAAGVTGFQLLPRRWVVKRTLAWLKGFRNLNHQRKQPGSTSLPHSFSSGDWRTHSTTFAIRIRALRVKRRYNDTACLMTTGGKDASDRRRGGPAVRLRNRLPASVTRRASMIEFLRSLTARRSLRSPLRAWALARTTSAPPLRGGRPDILASNGGSRDRISVRRASNTRKITLNKPGI